MSLPISDIVTVNVSVSAPQASAVEFDTGALLVYYSPTTTGLEPENATEIINSSTWVSQLTELGITANSTYTDLKNAYAGFEAYFSQTPQPKKAILVWIDRDLIADQDEPKTAVEQLAAAMESQSSFYCLTSTNDAATYGTGSLGAFVEASQKAMLYVAGFNDSYDLTATGGAIKAVSDLGYQKTACIYSSTPMKAQCALAGLISGLNTAAPNSAYTTAYKTLAGLVAENLTNTQYNYLISYRGNAYCRWGSSYSLFVPGIMAAKYHIDERYAIDLLSKKLSDDELSLLLSSRVIPQTEDGLALIVATANAVCEDVKKIGVIAEGKWNGPDVLDLSNGDIIPGGYLVQSESMADQSASDRAARRTPPIYVCAKLAGAVEHVVVELYVNT